MLTCLILSIDSSLYPSKPKLLYRLVWHYLPVWILDIVVNSPTREFNRIRSTSRLFREVAANLLQEKSSQAQDKAEEGHKDVLSILGESQCGLTIRH